MTYEEEGAAVGFTPEQLKFLEEWFPENEHHHSIEEVDGLAEALAGDDEGE